MDSDNAVGTNRLLRLAIRILRLSSRDGGSERRQSRSETQPETKTQRNINIAVQTLFGVWLQNKPSLFIITIFLALSSVFNKIKSVRFVNARRSTLKYASM